MAIQLYTWKTPNGRKASIALEEMGLRYHVHPINIGQGEQFTPEFLAVSPNNRIPAILDEDGLAGEPTAVFESGAILLYLGDKTGLFVPRTPQKRLDMMQWLMWQMGGFGPMLGQAHHFFRFAPEEIPYARERYHKESKRLYGVLDRHLADREYVAHDYSIADMAIYPWAARHEWHQVELAEFPHVQRWYGTLSARSGVQRGMAVPE